MLLKHFFTSIRHRRLYQKRFATKECSKLFALFKIKPYHSLNENLKYIEKVLSVIDFGYFSQNFLVHN